MNTTTINRTASPFLTMYATERPSVGQVYASVKQPNFWRIDSVPRTWAAPGAVCHVTCVAGPARGTSCTLYIAALAMPEYHTRELRVEQAVAEVRHCAAECCMYPLNQKELRDDIANAIAGVYEMDENRRHRKLNKMEAYQSLSAATRRHLVAYATRSCNEETRAFRAAEARGR